MAARGLGIRWLGAPALWLGVALLVGGLVGPAAAEDEVEEDRLGSHVGVGLALGLENFDRPDRASFDAGKGITAWLGHRPSRWVGGAVRLSLVQVEGETTTGQGDDAVKSDVDVLSTALGVDLKGYPLASVTPDWLQPYALAAGGLGWSRIETRTGAESADRTDVGFMARFGGGAEISLSHDRLALAVGADYVLTTEAIEDRDYVVFSFGLQYQLD